MWQSNDFELFGQHMWRIFIGCSEFQLIIYEHPMCWPNENPHIQEKNPWNTYPQDQTNPLVDILEPRIWGPRIVFP